MSARVSRPRRCSTSAGIQFWPVSRSTVHALVEHQEVVEGPIPSGVSRLPTDSCWMYWERPMGWTPRLRQPNKTLFAVRCKLLDRQDHCTAF